MLISKKQLSEFLSLDQGLTKVKSEKIIEFIFKKMEDSLSMENEVSVSGFGKFVVTERPARSGRNPLTGKKIKIAASKRVKFKPAKNLKELINK